jgi:tyrosine-protein kinase Etk/Wzc
VRSKDPELSALIAAEYPRAINDLVTRVAQDAATQQQMTLQQQILVAREHVVQSEQELMAFQRATGATDVDEQAKRTVEAAAQLQKGVFEQELRVAQLRRTAMAENPALRNEIAILNDLRAQLRGITAGTVQSDVLLSRTEFPELKIGLTRRLRDFMKDEQIYTSLTAALAQTQIDLKDYAAAVTVLDQPGVPNDPSGPSRIMLLLGGTLVGLLAGFLVALGREYVDRARLAGGSSQFLVAWEQMKDDVARLGRRHNGAARPGGRTPSGA